MNLHQGLCSFLLRISHYRMYDFYLIPQNRSIPLCTKQHKYGKIEVSRMLCKQHPEGELENAENRVCYKQ